MKGISPFVAEILLIGFTIAIAAIIITWSTGFTRTSSQYIQQQSESQVFCSHGGINTYGDVIYKDGYLYGYLVNSGNIPLRISFQIIYDNGTVQFLPDVVQNLLPGGLSYFNISINSNFLSVIINTNCTNPSINKQLNKNEIVFN